MSEMLFAYVGPETVVPVASALAAIGGTFLIFGRRLKIWSLKCCRIVLRRKDPEVDADGYATAESRG